MTSIKSIGYGILNMVCTILSSAVAAQDSTQTQPHYFAGMWANDWFQLYLKADRYYTNGLHFEMAHSGLSNMGKYVLWNPLKDSKSGYSFSIGQDIYTPTDLGNPEIDSTDRPYAGLLFSTFTRTANSFQKSTKWTSKLYVGVIGEISGAGQLQDGIHKINDSPRPQGWEHQIGNGLVLDYQINHQKMLPIALPFLEVNTTVVGRFGTIYNFISLGFTGKIGLFNTSFTNINGLFKKGRNKKAITMSDVRWFNRNKKRQAKERINYQNQPFQLYAHFNLTGGHVFYDGTAQGSLIAFEKSPYVLPQSTFSRSTGQSTYGATISYYRWQFTYTQTVLEDVFKGQGLYGWGQFKLLYTL